MDVVIDEVGSFEGVLTVENRLDIIESIWEQFYALLPERKIDHPLGCHRQRIPDRVVLEKLVEVLVFGCAYWRIADGSCSESTLRREGATSGSSSGSWSGSETSPSMPTIVSSGWSWAIWS